MAGTKEIAVADAPAVGWKDCRMVLHGNHSALAPEMYASWRQNVKAGADMALVLC